MARDEEKSVAYNPLEICYNILLKLSVRTLKRFKAVCKSWNALISDPQFIYLHLKVSENFGYFHLYTTVEKKIEYALSTNVVDPDELETGESILYPFYNEVEYKCSKEVFVLGSCNGLLLISHVYDTLLWNPTTGEYKVIGNSYRALVNKSLHHLSGLYYNPLLDEYNGIISVVLEKGQSSIYLCSTRSRIWKKLEGDHDFPYTPYIRHFFRQWDFSLPSCGYGITVNGVVHWPVKTDLININRNPDYIIYFDMAKRKFERLAIPTSPWLIYKCIYFSVFQGCLSATSFNLSKSPAQLVDVWSMKGFGVLKSWVKLFAIELVTYNITWEFTPLFFTTNGDEIVFRLNGMRIWTQNVITKKFKARTMLPYEAGRPIYYEESLVSP